MPPLPEAIILVLAPFAPLFSQRVWLHAPLLLLGGDAGSRRPYSHGRLTGHGAGHGALSHELPSGLEPGHMVGAPGQSDSAPVTHHVPCARRGDDPPRGGRHRGTPPWSQDHGQRLLSRCGALDQEACHPLSWPEMGVDDAPGSGAVGAVDMSDALSHRPVPAGQEVRTSADTRPVWIGCGR
jgi:hypothetical protein